MVFCQKNAEFCVLKRVRSIVPMFFSRNKLSVGLLLVLLLPGQLACQSDARTTTRIPPTPASIAKKVWQEDALQALGDLIAGKIDLDNNLYKRARIYLEQEKYQQAESDIDAAIDLKANVGEYYLLRAKIRHELNKNDLALEDAQRAEVLQQDIPELYILLADLNQEKQQYGDAQNYLVTALKMAPYEGDAYYVKGMLQSKMSDSLTGLDNLKYALSLNPRMLRAYKQISSVYSSLGNKREALRYNQMALDRYPVRAELHLARGEIYLRATNLDSAMFAYKKAVQLDSTLAPVHNRIGLIYLKWKSYFGALAAFQKTLKYEPGFPEANYLAGYCLEKIGNDERAAEFYTVEIQINPEDRVAQAALARIQYRKQRQYDPAGIFAAQKKTAGRRTPVIVPRTLDSSQVKIKTIQPRRTIDIGRDSVMKIKIK